MPQLLEPVPAPQQARLRHAVLEFRRSQHRRNFPTTVHVGDLAGRQASFVDSDHTDSSHRTRRSTGRGDLDFAQRADIIGALIDRAGPHSFDDPPLVWLTRVGDVGQIHDIDADWLAAANQAFAEVGFPLTMIVITRHGWCDPRSGAQRRWRRLR